MPEQRSMDGGNESPSQLSPAEKVTDLSLALSDQEVAEKKHRRAVRLNTVDIPILRWIGCSLLSLGVLLHNRRILESFDLRQWLELTLLLEGYAIVAWVILRSAYLRVKRFDLAVLFLVTDLIIWNVALLYSGGEKSWLFFILLLRVADQTNTTFRRALGFAGLLTASYGAMLWVSSLTTGQLSWRAGLAKMVFLGGASLYISLTARTAESRRASTAVAIRTARELIRQLREKSEQLEEARERAEDGNRAKSEFLANMSHEIRTPLNSITGLVQLAIDSGPSRDQKRYLETVRSSADGLLGILNQTLDLSKIEARMLELDPSATSFWDVVDEAVRSLAVRTEEKGLEISYRIDPRVPPVLIVDGLRLKQVLLNLLANAIKFTESGFIRLSVDLQSQSGSEVSLHFRLQDSGIGIEQSKQREIFDPFVQADGSSSRRFGGTGLGLSISKRLVQLMGGRLQVESAPGQGSTFFFTVSLCVSSNPPAMVASFTGLHAAVWVLGDNGDVLVSLLESLRVLVIRCRSSFELIDTSERVGAFLLLFVDAANDAVLELVSDGKQRENWRQALIIVAPASADPQVTARWIRSGVSEILNKPVSLAAVGLAISSSLKLEDRSRVQSPEVSFPGHASHSVLVVDDNLVNREIAAEFLARGGHLVTMAADGHQALELLAGHRFDAILMDLQMPELDGLATTARIREQERETGEHIPILAMTAYAFSDDRERSLAAGMDEHIAKPVREADLLARLNAVTRGRAPVSAPSREGRNEWIDNLGGDRRLAAKVAGLFARQAPLSLRAMQRAAQEQDFPALEREAHKLRGSLTNFDAEQPVELAVQLELAARARAEERITSLMQELQSSVGQLLAELGELHEDTLKLQLPKGS